MLYTSSGEGSCAEVDCAFEQYCAYHSAFTLGGQPVIYAIVPYGDPAGCANGATVPNDPAADAAATAAAHEIMEAASDPFGDAWWDINTGEEIGDVCNQNFGVNTWGAAATANQMWNGALFEVQQIWDAHSVACVQAGPQ